MAVPDKNDYFVVTIQEVAKVANVSPTTVSRVLNNPDSVKKKTLERVESVIKELNYQPNALGRRLRTASSSMILVILPDISNPFYSVIVKGIEDVARMNHFSVHLCNTDNDKNLINHYINLLKSKLADGAILMSTEIHNAYIQDLLRDYSFVQCCEHMDNYDISVVSINDFQGAQTAVRHLLSLGRRRIALVSCKNLFISNIKREEGYRTTLQDEQIEIEDDLIVYVDSHDYRNGARAVEQLFSLDSPPDAIFATSDVLAIGVIKGLIRKGRRVPEDVAVIGFDDIPIASYFNPSITTIAQPKYDIGALAMKQLLKQIKTGSKDPKKIVLEHDLIIRESTVK